MLPEELERPIIGIANSASELIPGHIHLHRIAQAVKDGVRMAGGTPFEFGTIGICDGIAMNHEGMKYSLGSRELIADSVEVMGKAYPFDGIVLIPNCDKIIPGMMMAALRLNIPAIVISGGPMLAGRFKGRPVDLISIFEGIGKVTAGLMTEEELAELEGMRLSRRRFVFRHVYGQLHELPERGPRHRLAGQWDNSRGPCRPHSPCEAGGQSDHGPRRTERDATADHDLEAFKNAITVDMAFGGSSNTALHLPAIAHEAGIDLPLTLFDEIAEKTPHICYMSPAGPHHLEDLDEAGGVYGIMKELSKKGLIDKTCARPSREKASGNCSNRRASRMQM